MKIIQLQNGTMYYNLTELYRVVHPLNFSRVDPDYSQTCHDATWTLARGLDTVIKRMTVKYKTNTMASSQLRLSRAYNSGI